MKRELLTVIAITVIAVGALMAISPESERVENPLSLGITYGTPVYLAFGYLCARLLSQRESDK